MRKYFAYCWATGLIGFGKEIPKGALGIASDKKIKRLKEVVRLYASDDGNFIVSVRLAYLKITDIDPVEALISFSEYINKILNNIRAKHD